MYYPQTWLWVNMLFGTSHCGHPCYSRLLAKKYSIRVTILSSIPETATIY